MAKLNENSSLKEIMDSLENTAKEIEENKVIYDNAITVVDKKTNFNDSSSIINILYDDSYIYVLKASKLVKTDLNFNVIFSISYPIFKCFCISEDYIYASTTENIYQINKKTGAVNRTITNNFVDNMYFYNNILYCYKNSTATMILINASSNLFSINLTKDCIPLSIKSFSAVGNIKVNSAGIYVLVQDSSDIASIYLLNHNLTQKIASAILRDSNGARKIMLLNNEVYVSCNRGLTGYLGEGYLNKYTSNLSLQIKLSDDKYKYLIGLDNDSNYIYATKSRYELEHSKIVKFSSNLSELNSYEFEGYGSPNIIYKNYNIYINGNIDNGTIARLALTKKFYVKREMF
ncbi:MULTISPECIES: hypothetical protein [unclassified Clostridioides]|uniref:hypothetical protein n=1 Tax=unclassified Clostridioides TaxID=2635829 RepID=UPI001D11041C|nr:hypothetical protein [Clostridioides sp. ZZV14-6150]MCC0724013.1 hypothetical protein [Clostridioides sp. ZZV14-6104]MCC0724852.1 hypothetical protein [Clostridioides sp. ZZV14-6045]MCC0732298.1 hypothetical protein [Clostridioides sp. ZZV14-6048]MCC0736435.1 hypothetical protein [Clostridioides sp. ZZV14-6009]MCC0740158.1 hypothetical protein [Clostridioides sp. ZZV14-5902]MCC0744174.1 hypothetical protein [Clostridioides sp. ZZV14-6044]MCC0752048.1 hypothetical protein [Clostridioides s